MPGLHERIRRGGGGRGRAEKVGDGGMTRLYLIRHAEAEAVAAAEELRDIARVLSIMAGTDTNIREAMTGILNIADRLEGGKSK